MWSAGGDARAVYPDAVGSATIIPLMPTITPLLPSVLEPIRTQASMGYSLRALSHIIFRLLSSETSGSASISSTARA